MPVFGSIRTYVLSTSVAGGGGIGYEATTFPKTSMASLPTPTSPPSMPKLTAFGLTGVPLPLGAILIKPWKGQTEPARPHPMAVVAYNVLVVRSQANPLTVKPTGPIVLMRLPVAG